MIAEIGSKFYPTMDAPTEAAARRIARKLEKTVDAMIAEWKRTERAAIAAEIRRRELLEPRRQERSRTTAHWRSRCGRNSPTKTSSRCTAGCFPAATLGDPILPKPKPCDHYSGGGDGYGQG